MRPLYLACIGYASGRRPTEDRHDQVWWQHIPATAAATQDALRRGSG